MRCDDRGKVKAVAFPTDIRYLSTVLEYRRLLDHKLKFLPAIPSLLWQLGGNHHG